MLADCSSTRGTALKRQVTVDVDRDHERIDRAHGCGFGRREHTAVDAAHERSTISARAPEANR